MGDRKTLVVLECGGGDTAFENGKVRENELRCSRIPGPFPKRRRAPLAAAVQNLAAIRLPALPTNPCLSVVETFGFLFRFKEDPVEY